VFNDPGSTIVNADVVGNQAIFKTSYIYKMTGAHSITATYTGDMSNSGSTSAALTEYVGTFPVASKLTLSSSISPSSAGQPVTFTASVRSAYAKYGAIPEGELVWFYDGTTVLGSGAVTGGKAEYTTSALTAMTHRIKATYTGDAIFKPCAATITQVVNPSAK
jgi:hypothetical protein